MGWSPHRPTGLTFRDPGRAAGGYTLITPPGDESYLLDGLGRAVHRWHYATILPGYAQLLPNGNLLARGVDRSLPPPQRPAFDEPHPPFPEHVRRFGGSASHLVELDWDGNVAWQYENPLLHHDFLRLANGNTLVALWSEMSPEVELAVEGGLARRPGEVLPPMAGDDIVEIDPAGNEVWRSSLWKLLDPVADPICPLESRWAWTWLNGIGLTGTGDVLFSCRSNSRVGIVSRKTGELLWKWGEPSVYHQHSPLGLPGGNVLLFDNGDHRRAGLPRSRVVEVDPATNEIAWRYEGTPPESFFSANVSNAEPLANGNVLVCEGASGRIFEVDRDGAICWEWVSPFQGTVAGRASVTLFRAHRYPADYPGLAGRDLDPARHRELNERHGLG